MSKDHPPSDRKRAMDAVLDYLAECTRDEVDWVEILRMRAAGASTTEIDAWIRQRHPADPEQTTGEKHKKANDRSSSQEWAPPKVITHVDVSRMTPGDRWR